MDRSPGFGSIIYDLIRAINTRFRFGSVSHVGLNLAINNNSLDRSTKSTTSRLKSLCLLVNIGFQILFHSPALRDGPRSFTRDFTCLVLLWIQPCEFSFRVQDFHLLWFYFPKDSTTITQSITLS